MSFNNKQYVMVFPYGNEDNYNHQFKPVEEVEMIHIVNKKLKENQLNPLVKDGLIDNIYDIPIPYKFIHQGFYRRNSQEVDIKYKQIIPYILVKTVENKYIVYKRKGSEERLRKWSMGIGGHIDIEDMERVSKYINVLESAPLLVFYITKKQLIPIHDKFFDMYDSKLKQVSENILFNSGLQIKLQNDFNILEENLRNIHFIIDDYSDFGKKFNKESIKYYYFMIWLTIFYQMIRELKEELNLQILQTNIFDNIIQLPITFKGVIDESENLTDEQIEEYNHYDKKPEDVFVGDVHFGLVFELTIPNQQVISQSDEIQEYQLKSLSEIKEMKKEGLLESWTEIQLDLIENNNFDS